MKNQLAIITIFVLITSQSFASTYIWVVPTGDWNSPASWSPVRTTPANNDNLVFDGSVMARSTAFNVSIETVAHLRIINHCTTSFMSIGTSALTLNGGAGSLQVDFGSVLKYVGTDDISITLPTLSSGTVNGDIIFSPESSSTRFFLLAEDSAAIIFTYGSSFQNAPPHFTNFGNPFGNSGTPNVVIFKSGSAYYHSGFKTYPSGNANNPFGLAAPLSKVVFEPGSFFYVWNNNIDMFTSYSGRTFGNLIFDFIGARERTIDISSLLTITDTCIFKSTQTEPLTLTGGGEISISGDLIFESGSAGLIDNSVLTTLTNIEIKGNLIALGSFTTNSSPNRVYLFDGSNAQTITLNSVYSFMPNLTVNNPAGVVLGSDITVCSTLTMMKGNIYPGAYNLTLGTSSTNQDTLSRTTGMIIGSLTQWISTEKQAYAFPIGTSANFNEATVNFTTGPSTVGTLKVTFTPSNPGENGLPLTDTDNHVLSYIATEGYWTITAGNGLTGGTYDLTLLTNGMNNFGGSGGRIVRRDNSSSPWTIGGTPGINSGNSIGRSGLSGSSDFGIAGTNPTYVPHFEMFH